MMIRVCEKTDPNQSIKQASKHSIILLSTTFLSLKTFKFVNQCPFVIEDLDISIF